MTPFRGAPLLAALFVVSALGQTKPNFTGTWRQIDNRNWVEVDTIDHQDPYLKVSTDARDTMTTSLPRVPGAMMRGEDEYRTDGDERAATGDSGRQSWKTVYWQGSILVFQSIVKDGYHVTVTRESWALSGAGDTLTKFRRVINMDGVTEKTTTFRKQ